MDGTLKLWQPPDPHEELTMLFRGNYPHRLNDHISEREAREKLYIDCALEHGHVLFLQGADGNGALIWARVPESEADRLAVEGPGEWVFEADQGMLWILEWVCDEGVTAWEYAPSVRAAMVEAGVSTNEDLVVWTRKGRRFGSMRTRRKWGRVGQVRHELSMED